MPRNPAHTTKTHDQKNKMKQKRTKNFGSDTGANASKDNIPKGITKSRLPIEDESDSDSVPEEIISRPKDLKIGKLKKKVSFVEPDQEEMSDESDEEEKSSDSEEEEEVGEESVRREDGSDEEENDSGEDQGENSEEEEEGGGDNISNEYAKLREELRNMPFDEIQRLKEKIGIKMYNQVMFGKDAPSTSGPRHFKRENKNRPMEVSSKVRPSKLRAVVHVKKRIFRDPRFDDLSGNYREDIFKKTYSFLDDIKQKEKDKVKARMKKEKNEDKKEQLRGLYKRMVAQEKAEKQKDQQKEVVRERRRHERTSVAGGKKPFYLKNSDKKKLELAEKFRELKAKGKLDQYLSRKRKKNASKEKRNLPALQP